MTDREAKDFLVQQASEQAALEGISLSPLEKRMMYFTESGYVPEDPIALNEEFESQYDTAEYEEKISKLLKHAYKRISAESDAKRAIWDTSIRCLSRGDHYLLVMCDLGAVGSAAGPVDWAIYGIALSAAAIVFALVLGMCWIAGRFAPPDARLIWAMLAVIVLCGIVFRARFGKALDWILDNTVVRILERKKREH